MPQQIAIVPSHSIDVAKLNACVANNENGLIYASTLYFNTITDNWHAIIINDYTAVMPLPWRKKWGIKYLYTPPFIQQLGLIGNVDEATAQAIILLITQQFQYGNVLMNFNNSFIATQKSVLEKSNFIIDLNNSYEAIKNNYHTSVNYSISKAEKAGCTYVSADTVDEAIMPYKEFNSNNLLHVNETVYQKLTIIFEKFQQQNKVLIRKVTNNKNELLSIVLLLKDDKRYYNIINYTSPKGRITDANYFLYNNVLKELANQQMLFDFEGSDLPGVKKFYEKFGAVNQPYFHWHFNQLPFPFNLLKR